MTEHLNERDWITEYTETGVRLLLKRAITAKGAPFNQAETTENLLKIAFLVDADVEGECARWAKLANYWSENNADFPQTLVSLMIRQAAITLKRFNALEEKEGNHA